MRRLKLFFASLALLLCLIPAAPAAAAFNPFGDVCSKNPSLKDTPACRADGSDPLTGKNGILYKVSRIIAMIAGISAVFMMMFGGFMYITANGEANKASNGKTIITAAVIGLVVIALAETILSFVISAVS